MNDDSLKALRAIVGDASVLTDPNQLYTRSQDHYYFSPVLKPQLDGKVADVSVRPSSIEQLAEIVSLAVEQRIPITPRGAGTGNYGQGVPMHGGILLDLNGLNRILDVRPERMTVQAGTKLIDMEKRARASGSELRYYPSTLLTATAGGFLAGGSGGIGSVTWGTMWDGDQAGNANVSRATVMTVEDKPRLVEVATPEAMLGVIHNCGLTGIIVDATFALAPARQWQQHAVAFDDFDDALRFGQSLAHDGGVVKRLICLLEADIAALFRQLVRVGAAPAGKAIALLELEHDPSEVAGFAAQHKGEPVWHSPHESYHVSGKLMLSDFSWNHTTLWARKSDPSLTYLQDRFDPARVFDQRHARKARYGNDVLDHIEFMKFRGVMYPQGLSIVRFKSREQLWDIIEYSESIGMWIANPHTHRLDEDVRWNGQYILDAKLRWDPHALLNPGHLKALEQASQPV